MRVHCVGWPERVLCVFAGRARAKRADRHVALVCAHRSGGSAHADTRYAHRAARRVARLSPGRRRTPARAGARAFRRLLRTRADGELCQLQLVWAAPMDGTLRRGGFADAGAGSVWRNGRTFLAQAGEPDLLQWPAEQPARKRRLWLRQLRHARWQAAFAGSAQRRL